MKIKILTSNCKKGECGPECPYCRLSETFSSLAGSKAFHNEEGILQESPENIIPPAFNRFLALAKIGHPPLTESGLPQVTSASSMRGRSAVERGEKLQAQMAEYIERNEMKSKAAQDVFAQYVIRYIGEAFETRRGNLIETNLNSVSVNEVLQQALNRLNFGAKGWEAFREAVYGGSVIPDEDEEKINKQWMEKQKAWFNLLDDFQTDSPTSEQWDGKYAQMVDNGASPQELLVYLGKQYKSRVKSIKKFFQKNPELGPMQAETLEYVRRAWDYWQDKIVSHSMGNLRKIGKFLEEEKFVGELGALLKKYPSYDEQDGATGDFTQRSSLYHANEFIDNEMIKGELEVCDEGFASAMQPIPDDRDNAKPCVLKEYDDGFFWWNRKASSCDVAGEEMANCGSSNYESSTLLILKEKVNNDSAEVRDKIKGRIMLEYNSDQNEMVQILGFGNSFPQKEYWEKIKDAWKELDGPKIGERAFTHLANSGRADREAINSFLEYVGDGKSTPPVSFFREEEHTNSFIDRLRNEWYHTNDEAARGGSTRLSFDSEHVSSDGSSKKAYAPIEVEGYIGPVPYVVLPGMTRSAAPSLERGLFGSLTIAASEGEPIPSKDKKEDDTGSHDVVKGLLENKLKRAIRSAILDMPRDVQGNVIVSAGTAEDAGTRSANTFEFLRYNVQTRETSPGNGRARFRIYFKFNIVPEVFTDEGRDVDEPQGAMAHEALLAVRRRLAGDKMLVMLNDAIEAENRRLNPPEKGQPPYDYDNPPEDVVLSLAEIIQEMEDIKQDHSEGVTFTTFTRRLFVVYRSLVSPRGNGYMNIDALSREIKDAWAEFVSQDDYWANEWHRLEMDSQARVQEMGGQAVLDQAEREGDMTGADDVATPDDSLDEIGQQRRYYGHDHAQGILRFTRGNMDLDTVATNVRRILRDFDQFNPLGDWDHSNIAKAKLNAIDANYDLDNMTHVLSGEEIDKALNLVIAINRGDFDNEESDEDIEQDQAQPVDFGGGAEDYADRFRQQTGQDYEEYETQSAADARHQLRIRLRGRANLFVRMVNAPNSQGWDYYSGTSIWARTKEEMIEQGIYLDWLETLPNDSPIRQAELEDARREANMTDNQRNLIARGNMMVRYLERTPRRVENPAFRGTMQRLKSRMKEEGLWDTWWPTVPDSSPLKTSGVMDDDQTLVEARDLVNNLLGIKQSDRIRININENMGASPEVQRSTTVDEHFLDFLEEKIPSLDVENPNEVKAVIWAIENNDTAEQVFKALEQHGLVTRHMDSAAETTAFQIRQIQTIMTSHWFSKIEQLYEGKRRQTVGILPYRMIEGEIEFLIGEMTNIYHALPDETPEPDFQGKWTCFKGGVDDGEDEKSAARREFQEESTFTWNGQLDDSKIVQNKKVKIWLVDAADLDPSKFNRNNVDKITGDYLNGMPEIWSIGWFSPEETQSKLANSQKDLIPQAIEILTDSADIPEEPENEGAPMSFALNENENITTLHIFDFDDTIAFTNTLTKVTAPDRETYDLDQAGLDKLLKSNDLGQDGLEGDGYVFDFSGFRTVSPDSKLNPVIVRRIDACCLAGGRDPNGDFYVLTARAAAAEGPIHQYLADNGIEIDRSKVIGVEGKSKASRIKSLISGTNVKKVIFYDDSDNNIKDVAGLRQDPELQDVTFELYPVDEEGNIPKKPMQETNYDRKRFKIKIGARQMKLRVINEKVFSKDLDGDGEAEVPDDRQGETGAPEVNMDGGLSDKDNDGDTDLASSKEPAEPEVEEVPGDDELAAELAALEEDVGRMIKLKLVQEEVLDEGSISPDRWSKIKAWQPEAHGLVYYNPQGEGPCLAGGMVRIAASLSVQGIGDRSFERNRVRLEIQQPGFYVTGENKGKLSIEPLNITVDGRHVVQHGNVGFVDVANWVLRRKGITDEYANLLDYNGKIIATKNMQLKYSNARKCPRDNK